MKQISDRLYVGPQLTTEDVRHAKSQGFAAIVNNRPDGEEPGQPSAAENRSVAEDAQLAYTHIPVTAGQIDETQVRAFQEALSQANGPVLAHCKTGLAPYKYPRWINFVAELPKTATGKIQRFRLRQ